MTSPIRIECRSSPQGDLPFADDLETAPLDVSEADLPEALEAKPESAKPAVADSRGMNRQRSTRLPLLARVLYGIFRVVTWLFGESFLMFSLAVLAAIPVLNLFTLGYLLESSARVARTGRLRDGFIGERFAAFIGSIVLACVFGMLPVWIVRDFARSAAIIDPGGRIAMQWALGQTILSFATGIAFLIIMAVAAYAWLTVHGVTRNYYQAARDAVWNQLVAMDLWHYFWLGLRGFLAAFAWLAIPISLLVVSRYGHSAGASFLGLIGAGLLVLILPYLPFLQLRLAMTNRFRGGFELLSVRRDYRRAPWAFAFAFVVTLLFALPLYILKIQVLPREAAWLPSLVFITFIFPARLLTGWAMGRANRLAARRSTPRHWFFRWTGRIPLLPAAAFYVLIVFFTQYTSWNGVWSLFEQHAFLVPVPFFGL